MLRDLWMNISDLAGADRGAGFNDAIAAALDVLESAGFYAGISSAADEMDRMAEDLAAIRRQRDGLQERLDDLRAEKEIMS